MALKFIDRLLTVVVTATLTSAVWIVAGGTLMQRATGISTMGAAADTQADSAQASEGRSPPMIVDKPQSRVAPDATSMAGLMVPVAGIGPDALVDTFNQARDGGARLHDAIDIMAPVGTPVVAAADGKVERLFLSDAGGKTIYVRTPDGRSIHYYAHLDSYAPDLKENAPVRRGQQIGTVGSTGNADPSAPHLHFAVMLTTPDAAWSEPSTAVNPYPLLVRR